jgi:hypothetical protein
MEVLDALNWPVFRCPRLAGFEVSPEVISWDSLVPAVRAIRAVLVLS